MENGLMHIEIFKGDEAAPYMRPLSEMRVAEFYHFPGLYAGNVEDDLIYTQEYASSPQGILVIAFEGDTIVGTRSGIPIRETQAKILDDGRLQQFEKQGIKASDYYYCGEMIVNPAFRRMGIATQLMAKFTREVKAMGFPGLIAITSIRPPDHPLCPPNYFDTSTLWPKFGFEKSTVIFPAKYPTRQRDGTVREEENPLVCWVNTFKP